MTHRTSIPSRHERGVNALASREGGFRHADARERGCILADIDAEIDLRTLFRTEAHDVLGLASGSLDDGSLTTERLRKARIAARALPNVQLNLSGRHRHEAILTLDMVTP